MKYFAMMFAAATLFSVTACDTMTAGPASVDTAESAGVVDFYTFEITNNLHDEPIAPVLVAPVAYDDHIFQGDYVTPAAEHQILTGDPSRLAASMGTAATVAHGMDGPPGVLLGPGKSLSFRVPGDVQKVRLIAMVAPVKVPDNYLTTEVQVRDGARARLHRFDIGHNEHRHTIRRVALGGANLLITLGASENSRHILPVIDPVPGPGAIVEIVKSRP